MNQEYKIPSSIESDPMIMNGTSFRYEINLDSPEKNNVSTENLFAIGDRITEARSEYLSRKFPDSGQRILIGVVDRMFKDKYKNKTPRNISDLKQVESQIGSSLFIDSTAPGESIRFFNDNRQSWFFHREDVDGQIGKSKTLHYEIQENGILRVNNDNGISSEFIDGQELKNFTDATEMYEELIFSRIYNNPDKFNNSNYTL